MDLDTRLIVRSDGAHHRTTLRAFIHDNTAPEVEFALDDLARLLTGLRRVGVAKIGQIIVETE